MLNKEIHLPRDLDNSSIRSEIAEEAWGWFERHKNEVVFSQKIVFLFTIHLTVKDCKPIFVKLFGPQPLYQL